MWFREWSLDDVIVEMEFDFVYLLKMVVFYNNINLYVEKSIWK